MKNDLTTKTGRTQRGFKKMGHPNRMVDEVDRNRQRQTLSLRSRKSISRQRLQVAFPVRLCRAQEMGIEPKGAIVEGVDI